MNPGGLENTFPAGKEGLGGGGRATENETDGATADRNTWFYIIYGDKIQFLDIIRFHGKGIMQIPEMGLTAWAQLRVGRLLSLGGRQNFPLCLL